jgi:hypothetical protein
LFSEARKRPITAGKVKSQSSLIVFERGVDVKKRFVLVLILITLIVLSVSSLKPASATGDSWVSKAPLPTARRDLGVAVVDNKIYAIGGISEKGYANITEQYDPATDTWTTKAQMPIARSNLATAVYENKIYIFGGYTFGGFSNATEVYDPTTDNWTAKSSMPINTNTAYLYAHTIKDKIYIFTDNYDYYNNRTVILVYEPNTDLWTVKYFDVALMNDISAAIGNQVYFPGNPGKWNAYNAETDNWTLRAPCPYFFDAKAIATSGEYAPIRMYVFGVKSEMDQDPMPTRIYDPKNDSWTFGADVPTNRQDFGLAVVNDTIYVIGGVKFTYPWPDDYAVLKLNSANEQYIPAGYGTPDPAYQTPTATPQLNTSTNSESASPQTQLFIAAAAVALAVLAGIILLKSKRKHQLKT